EALTGVRKAFADVKTSVQFTELKSARSRRTIALPAVAIAALRTHRVRQLEDRLVARGLRKGNWPRRELNLNPQIKSRFGRIFGHLRIRSTNRVNSFCFSGLASI